MHSCFTFWSGRSPVPHSHGVHGRSAFWSRRPSLWAPSSASCCASRSLLTSNRGATLHSRGLWATLGFFSEPFTFSWLSLSSTTTPSSKRLQCIMFCSRTTETTTQSNQLTSGTDTLRGQSCLFERSLPAGICTHLLSLFFPCHTQTIQWRSKQQEQLVISFLF